MPKFAANLTMLWNELDFLDRFAAAAKAGFSAVEYLFPYPHPKEQLADRLAKHKLKQVLHNLPAGDWAKGERGIACLPDRVGEFQEGVGRAIDYASALSCKQVNCLAGIAPPGVDAARVRETIVSNLKFAAPKLAAAGIRLLIEPINTRDIPGFYLSRTAQAIDLIAAVGSDNLWLQYDIYHMQIMEGDLIETIRHNIRWIGHFHTGGVPGRHELDDSQEVNWHAVAAAIADSGFQGYLAHEFVPQGDPLPALEQAVRICTV